MRNPAQGRNFDKAIECYTKSIELDSESNNAALCYSNRAACYQVVCRSDNYPLRLMHGCSWRRAARRGTQSLRQAVH